MALQRACTLAILCVAICSFGPRTAGGKPAPRIDARKQVAVAPVSRQPSGGLIGTIPIGYYSAPQRTGSYYLPVKWWKRAMPILVVLHGSGGRGYDILSAFKHLADYYGFLIVAPDSHNKDQWFTPNSGQAFTSDWEHIEACFQYVKNIRGVRINPRRVAYAGFSRGGYAASAMASRVGRATHAMVYHSLVLKSQFGKNRLRGLWISTGVSDQLFPPRRVGPAITAFKNAEPYYRNRIHFQTFSGGHNTNNVGGELNSSIKWWFRT
jgi:predicted esterase